VGKSWRVGIERVCGFDERQASPVDRLRRPD
jgi:hypothetical protein